MNLNNLGLVDTDDPDILTARMRHQRDRLLAASDWTQHLDAPVADRNTPPFDETHVTV